MYLIPITISLAIGYFILLWFFPLFFEQKTGKVSKKSFLSVAIIFALSLLLYFIVSNIGDPWWANRFQHAMAGGFITFVVCFLAAKDSGFPKRRFQFFFISILIVAGLGVCSEIVESVMQNYAGLTMSSSINDTWLDLISNTVGSLLAALILTPFIEWRKN